MSQIKQVKDASDIVDVIGQRLELVRSGSSLKAPCPFHGEKTPSFFVSEVMQRYKCFGCGESGDVINFLEKYEGMTFGEALEYLADQAGIKLEKFAKPKADQDREELLTVLDLARQYYAYLLTEHETGKEALAYLKDRGVTNESIKLFQLGFAQNSWDGLINYLNKKKHFSLEILERAGLVVNRSGRYYDRFRGRIMFPLKNHRGQVVGFSGRTMIKDAKEAKYINSPETELYHKSEMLFGFSELYQEIRKKKELIVTEGEFDVISSSQVHVNNVVAVKGSVLTKQHVKLISRVAGKIILALDQDSAGVEATKRAITIADGSDLEIRVANLAVLPPELRSKLKDPDDIARGEPKLWREAVKTSISVYEFLLQTALKNHDPATPEGKREIIVELAPIFEQITHLVERDFYVKKLAAAIGVKKEMVEDDLKKSARNTKSSQVFKTKQESAAGPDSKPAKKLSTRLKFERYLVFLLLSFAPAELKEKVAVVTDMNFSTGELEFFIKSLATGLQKGKQLKVIMFDLPDDVKEIIGEIYLSPKYQAYVKDLSIQSEWESVLARLQDLIIKDEVKQITIELDKLEKQLILSPADEERQNELLAKIVSLKRR